MTPKESAAAFEEMDANCNSCIAFHRLPHDRAPDKLMRGWCNFATDHPLIYRKRGHEFWVNGSDNMSMPCWASRRAP